MPRSPRPGRDTHRFRFAGSLRAPAGFDVLASVSVGVHGPVAVWTSAAGLDQLTGRNPDAAGASFPWTRTVEPPAVALATYRGDAEAAEQVVLVDGLPVAHPLVGSLPGGRFLVAGARCRWGPDGPEQNALVFGPDGDVERTGTLGDGIEHLLMDRAGTVWTGYFDEGVFGNLGWSASGPRAIGAAGLVRWSPELTTLWQLDPQEGLISDCYVLNVDGDLVWVCPYTDFPIVRVAAGRVTVEATEGVSGPRGLLVSDRNVAVIGSYGSPGALLLGSLDRPRGLRPGELKMPDGRPVPRGELVCRGSVAHLFVGADRYVFNLAELGR